MDYMNDKYVNKILADASILDDILLKRPESLSKYLPYEEYLDKYKVFVNKDATIGMVLELELLEHEAMVTRDVISRVASLKSLLNLPENCVLQVLFDQSYISGHDKCWDQVSNEHQFAHPVSKLVFDEKINHIKSQCNTSGPLAPFKRRNLITIKYIPNQKAVSEWKGCLHKNDYAIVETLKNFTGELKTFTQLMDQYIGNSKVDLNQMDAQGLLDYLRQFFNPKEYYKRNFMEFNSSFSISSQAIYNSPILDHSGILREGRKTRTITLKTSPQFAYAGGMSYFLNLKFPFKLCMNFSFPSKVKVKKFFDTKEFFLKNNISRAAKVQREEIKDAQERMTGGERCLYMTFFIVIEGESDEELDKRTREIVNVFQNDLNCEVIIETRIGMGLVFHGLPLNYSPRADFSTQRYIRILQEDATKFIPVFDSFRGLDTPTNLYLSRENNLVPFNLLENATSNHTVVLADSGSGKSAFIIDCMQAAKRMDPEPLIFVIDKKSSYKGMVHPFKGDLTIFSPNLEMPFSPFRGEFDDKKVEFLTQLMITAINLTSKSFEVESEHITVISKALKNAYLKKSSESGLTYVEGELVKSEDDQQIEIEMEDFIAALSSLTSEEDFESMHEPIDSVLMKLKPFYGDGNYARYFKTSGKSFNKNCLFYVYDLDALKDPTLQILMTMSVIEEIRTMILKPENQDRGGFIVIEELGMLGRDNPTAKDFIVDAAETFRKLGFWLIGLTPRPKNFFEMDAGEAMWSVADNYIFLRMNQDNIDYVAEKSNILDEAGVQIVNSLKLKEGEYTEVFYINKDRTKKGSFRYHQTAYDRWLAPTNNKDLRTLEKEIKKFDGEGWEAMKSLVEKEKEATNEK